MSAGDTAAATPEGADRLVTVDRPQPRTAVVTLNRPDRLNAMSIDLVIELDAALNAIVGPGISWRRRSDCVGVSWIVPLTEIVNASPARSTVGLVLTATGRGSA